MKEGEEACEGRAWSEGGVKDEGRTERGEMNEGRQVGEHGVGEEGRTERGDMKEGRHVRGEHGVREGEGGMEGRVGEK